MQKKRINLTLQENAQMFKALGDEVRLRILALLNTGELCVCDIMEILALPQSTISRHLAYLKNSHCVVGRRSGKWMYYQLSADVAEQPALKTIQEYIALIPELKAEQKRLKNYLKNTNNKVHCS